MPLVPRFRRWWFGKQRVEPSPVTLGFRRIYILPTSSGLFFGVVLLLMYSGAVNYNLGLGHALVFLLVGLGVVAMLHTVRNIFGLRLSAGPAPAVFAGQTAEFAIIIENPEMRMRPAVALRNEYGHFVDADLPPLAAAPFRLRAPTQARGWFELGRLTLSSRYPVGLFRAWAYPSPASRCLVYPKPDFRPLPPPRPAGPGGHLHSTSGDEDFAGFRNRQPGDSLRHVAWKSFARDPEHRPLQVKLFAGGQQSELCLSLADLPSTLDLENRLSILTGWVIQAEASGIAFGLELSDEKFAVDSGSLHAERCLHALACFGEKPDGEDIKADKQGARGVA
jgi:uncharacterized protein (DUF58 family)